jgi:hypothetical protein
MRYYQTPKPTETRFSLIILSWPILKSSTERTVQVVEGHANIGWNSGHVVIQFTDIHPKLHKPDMICNQTLMACSPTYGQIAIISCRDLRTEVSKGQQMDSITVSAVTSVGGLQAQKGTTFFL